MYVGTFKETIEGECRVAISPESCKKLTELGCNILIEKDIMIPYQKCKNLGNFFRICFANSNCTNKYIDYLVETIKQIL